MNIKTILILCDYDYEKVEKVIRSDSYITRMREDYSSSEWCAGFMWVNKETIEWYIEYYKL